jgi:hypothetical protein
MTIYVSNGIPDNSINELNNIKWIQTSPIVGRPSYPIILDVVESAISRRPGKLISIIREAMAPSFESINIGNNENKVNYLDIPYEEEEAETNLMMGIVEFAGSLGEDYGIIFHNPELYDYDSYNLMSRLVRRSKMQNLNLMIDTSRDFRKFLNVHDIHDVVILDHKLEQHSISSTDLLYPAFRILSQCPHGLPQFVLDKLVPDFDKNLIASCIGPTNTPWNFILQKYRNRINKVLTNNEKQEINMRIFDSWNPIGWNYLRRAYHGIQSGKIEKILSQHRIYSMTMKRVSEFFLNEYYSRLTEIFRERSYTDEYFNGLVNTARLAKRTYQKYSNDKNWSNKTIRYYKACIKNARDNSKKIDLMSELANFYANQRTNIALSKARKLYEETFRSLENYKNNLSERDFLDFEINLHNGAALVEYHVGRNDEALLLEEGAKSLSELAASRYPEFIGVLLLVYYNYALLMAKRFSNIKLATKLLTKCINFQIREHPDANPATRLAARMYLAELYFDSGKYSNVICLLEDYFELNIFTDHRIYDVLHRLFFIISLIFERQLGRADIQVRKLEERAILRNLTGLYDIIHSLKEVTHSDNILTNIASTENL